MPETNEQYVFAALRVPKKVAETLASVQRELSQELKKLERQYKLLPRRMFLVPIFDFKHVPMSSHEAVTLAFERERRVGDVLTLSVERIAFWPSATAPEQIVAILSDHGAAIQALRGRVCGQVERYGFEIQPEGWQPIIPLIRLQNAEPCEALEFDFQMSDLAPWTVNSISILGRETAQRSRFQLRQKVELGKVNNADDIGPTDDAVVIEALAKELQERIEQRRLRLSESMRNERNRNLRMEEPSIEPQGINHEEQVDT